MLKILLVEDDKNNREMLSYRLKRRDYKLLIAINGAEAIALAIAEKPDLILMDLSLPIVNGWEATKQIKNNIGTKNIPIIALTAHAMNGDRHKALKVGCDDYQAKPINFPLLLDKIQSLLDQDSDYKHKNLALDSNETEVISLPKSVDQSLVLDATTPVKSTVTDAITTKILLVEDDENNREMLSYRLKRRNYKLVIAVDGADAVSLAAVEQPDLILMDLSLPIINGWEATRRIKANPNTRNIPVIALTAHAMGGDRQKALEAGCDDYEAKPIDFPHLIDKMKVLLDQISDSKPENIASRLDVIEFKNQSQSISKKPFKHEPSELIRFNMIEPIEVLNKDLDILSQQPPKLSQEETGLLPLKKIIKVVYSPIDKRNWRTGSLVKLSKDKARINSNKMHLISPSNTIEIRIFTSGNLNLSEVIYAEILEIFHEDDEYFLVKFSSRYKQVNELLGTFT